jgi:hypothetical protein
MMTLIYCPRLDCESIKDICTSKDYGVCLKSELTMLKHNVGGYACCADYEKQNKTGGGKIDKRNK